jgi:hypothetical protein
MNLWHERDPESFWKAVHESRGKITPYATAERRRYVAKRHRNVLGLAGGIGGLALALLAVVLVTRAEARAFNSEKWWEGGGMRMCFNFAGYEIYCQTFEVPGIQLPQLPQLPYTPQGYLKPSS